MINCPADIYQDLHDEEPPVVHCTNSNDILKNLQILKDEKLRNNLGLKGRNWIVAHHSPKIVISKMVSIYKMILEDKNKIKISKIKSN